MKFLAFVLCGLTSAASAQLQYVCEFNTEVKLSSLKTESPNPLVVRSPSKYGFYIDSKTNSAEYLNFARGAKIGLRYYMTSSMLVLTEDSDGDNHFNVTIFNINRANGRFPAVMSVHAWNEKVDYYHPSISLGECHSV